MRVIVSLLLVALLSACAGKDAQDQNSAQKFNRTDLYLPAELISAASARVEAIIVRNLPVNVVKKEAVKDVKGGGSVVVLHSYKDDQVVEPGAVIVPTEGDSDDHEVVMRRVEKLALEPICRAIGFEECLNPLCVLHPFENVPELDAKARDVCPICAGKLESLLADKEREIYLVVE